MKYRKSTPERTAENVLKRDFNASSPNEKWVTDVTEFKWYEGPVCHKLYLSAILDLYDRSVVSHVISRHNDNKLVFQTFDKAIANNPDARPIFHSDRGFQYTGRVFQTKLTNQEMAHSMSRVGRCIKKLTVPEKGTGEHNRTIFYLFLRSTLTGADQGVCRQRSPATGLKKPCK